MEARLPYRAALSWAKLQGLHSSVALAKSRRLRMASRPGAMAPNLPLPRRATYSCSRSTVTSSYSSAHPLFMGGRARPPRTATADCSRRQNGQPRATCHGSPLRNRVVTRSVSLLCMPNAESAVLPSDTRCLRMANGASFRRPGHAIARPAGKMSAVPCIKINTARLAVRGFGPIARPPPLNYASVLETWIRSGGRADGGGADREARCCGVRQLRLANP